MNIGIDSLALYTSRYAMELDTLAEARGVDADKYHVGLGQYVMSVPPPGEDVVTMAANAGERALRDVNINDIEMVLFATESGIDQSKAAGIYVHGLLGLPSRCRVIELKQACYSGTAAIQLACSFIRENPYKKVLVCASDIARYGLNTSGESSQGAGAIALVMSANPRILTIEQGNGIVTENVMDFWRPNYSHVAYVDGKYSSKLYLIMLEKCWAQYQTITQRQFQDHAYFCYHTPVPRLVEKAHHHLLKINKLQLPETLATQQIHAGLEYGRLIGNSYSASLYIGLASLLDHASENLENKRIGFYSYGSGSVAEYFSGIVQPGYRDRLNTDFHASLFATRKRLNYSEYQEFFDFKLIENGGEQDIPLFNTGNFRLTKMQQHKRIYEKRETKEQSPSNHLSTKIITKAQDLSYAKAQKEDFIKVYAPGKLILSGEHAVVYGQPALAMAVNRYVSATVTQEKVPQVLFDLSDLSHHSRLTFDALNHLKNKIKQKYYRFIRGDFSIRDVLQKPFELAQFAMGVFAESLNLVIHQGVKIKVQSELPIGCGMGSSAATVVSVMQALSRYMQLTLSDDKFFHLALEAENMQHGYSSGLDLRLAMQGGCLYMHGQRSETRDIPAFPMYLINTGMPMTSTGQCIETVAPFFKSQNLCDEFALVTHDMDKALRNESWADMQTAIRKNHRLLVKIGVVPQTVQTFISQIEASGGSAKICGAGATAGEKAGALLVNSEDKTVVTSLASRYGYQIIPISGESRGMHAA